MTDGAFSPRDRIAGLAILGGAVALMLVPTAQLGGQTVRLPLVAAAWLCAAVLLLTGDDAARPNPRLMRLGAATLFVTGLLAPFVANLIDFSSGA